MGTIFRDTPVRLRLLTGEKTANPILRVIPKGKTHDDFAQGEFVGARSTAGGNEYARKIASVADEAAYVKGALMRYNRTSNDVLESGRITCLEGLYRLSTQLFVKGQTYQQGDRLTLRYSASESGGVLGPVTAYNDGAAHDAALYALAEVIVPPMDGSQKDSTMTVLVFPQAVKV